MTVAKKTLEPGDVLDDFGGYTFHGVMDRAAEAMRVGALPAGLAPGARVKHRVWKGKIITWDDVELDEASSVVKLRRMQNAL
jgi:predicted homoserine dehydrogenase-like protein